MYEWQTNRQTEMAQTYYSGLVSSLLNKMKHRKTNQTNQTNKQKKTPGNCNLEPSSQEDQLNSAKSTLEPINVYTKLGYFSGGFTAFE